VRLLLDTHILLWSLMDDPRLTTRYQMALNNSEEVFVSAVSIWEISIKQALGRLQVDGDVLSIVRKTNCQQLNVTWEHAKAAGMLPRHHDDPFDRLLIAQARCEGLTFASSDRMIQRYEVALL
jgi:PIN domain nuclease of toxin-antitoxin system